MEPILSQNKPALKLDWCSHGAAKYAVEHWHYSRTMPKSKRNYLGVWEDEIFIGAIIFALGASSHLGAPYWLNTFQCCELVRVALTKHGTAVSRIVAIAISLLKKQSPNLRLIVSYADPMEGHAGGIYQAGNWIYTGTTSPDWAVIDRRGKKWHSRVASESGFKSQYGRRVRVIKPSEGTKIILPGKHRYLMPLDDEMRKRIELLRKPYPKRAGSIDRDAPAIHAGEDARRDPGAPESSKIA